MNGCDKLSVLKIEYMIWAYAFVYTDFSPLAALFVHHFISCVLCWTEVAIVLEDPLK